MLKNASEVSWVPKNLFFLKILNLVQSFVECKGSLADGMHEYYPLARGWFLEQLTSLSSRVGWRLPPPRYSLLKQNLGREVPMAHVMIHPTLWPTCVRCLPVFLLLSSLITTSPAAWFEVWTLERELCVSCRPEKLLTLVPILLNFYVQTIIRGFFFEWWEFHQL